MENQVSKLMKTNENLVRIPYIVEINRLIVTARKQYTRRPEAKLFCSQMCEESCKSVVVAYFHWVYTLLLVVGHSFD